MSNRFAFLLPIMIVAITTLTIGLSLEPAAAKLIYQEGRLVENATVVIYGLAIVVALAVNRPNLGLRCHTALVLAIMAGRELDLHKSFTTESMFKISYYMKPHDPVMIRVLAGCLVLILLGVFLSYARHLKGVWRNLWEGRAHAITVAVVLVTVPVSKIFDSSPRMVHKFLGIDFPDELRFWLLLSEESLELLIPVLILLAVVQYNLSTATVRPAIHKQA